MKKIIKKFGRAYINFFELYQKEGFIMIPATILAIIIWFAWLALMFKK